MRSDFDIRQDVEAAINTDVRLSPSNINVDVVNGVVHLRGSVDDSFQKRVAAEDAWGIPGVTDVINELSVKLPSPTSDQQITSNVQAALGRDVAVNTLPINVNTIGGVVYLSGTVSSYSQKVDAADDAWTVPGVIDVVNNVVVQPVAPIPTDQEVTDNVRSILSNDVRIDMTNVTVSVQNGVVYLRGTVPTFDQKMDAASDAWVVKGVIDVVNELTVAPYARAAY